MNEKTSKISYPAISTFDFSIKYNETDRRTHVREIDLHAHKECEIYVNLSGDVSFMVGNRLYPLHRGDVIVARPEEYHHCVYHSDAPHALYWILFDTSGNEAVLAPFFEHLRRHGNLISPEGEERERLLLLCERLLHTPPSPLRRYALFFELLSIIETSHHGTEHTELALPADLITVLDHIDAHISEPLTLGELSRITYTTPSTLERRFSKHLGMPVSVFIRRRKMSVAAQLLEQGYSVLAAGEAVGYTDNSHFIKRFGEYCGMTPLQYKKAYGDKK